MLRLGMLTAVGCLLCGAMLCAGDRAHFYTGVTPILLRSCIECHSGLEPEGGLDLTTREGWVRGGESGSALSQDAPTEGLAHRRVAAGEMPPKHPLPDADRATLLNWLASGAPWGDGPLDLFQVTTSQRAGYDWWSLQRVRQPKIPQAGTDWARNAIDRFVAAQLEQQQLEPADPADRRVLIRRLSFDLLGLPPAPEDVARFVADDRPDAYEQLVDRLLASPDYGVRWGRHWLDIVRFGESQGFERDKLRENSWPYRDWVIEAFNGDLPYAEFARQQLAGDVLDGGGPQGLIATGFLVAGPWDEVGHKQQSAAMRAVVRQDELEDYASLVGQTFLGLTVHCARCHDHKFDPIRQSEYYQLTAALDGIHHGDRTVQSPEDLRRREELSRLIAAEAAVISDLRRATQARLLAARGSTLAGDPPPQPIARWTFDGDAQDSIGGLHAELRGGARLVDGALVVDGREAYAVTSTIKKRLREKTLAAWVRLADLEQRGGGVISIDATEGDSFDAIVFGEREPQRWMAGSSGFIRTQSFAAPQDEMVQDRAVHFAITYHADGTIAGYRDGEPYGTAYKAESPVIFPAERARILFGLRHATPGGNRMLNAAIDAAELYDRALTSGEVAVVARSGPAAITDVELYAALTNDERLRWDATVVAQKQLQLEYDSIQGLSVYAVEPTPPGLTHVLLRGNPTTPADAVVPGAIPAVSGPTADFGLAGDADDASRRRALAAWITDDRNPLFPRVLVNRVWQYHFGSGLVATPSDFGFSGGLPSHPELLDWLAIEFQRSGGSIKALQRLIVTSATYRQSSDQRTEAAARDAGNRWLWRMSPRRLEAETLRDAMLSVAGELNPTLGGPGYRDFTTFVHNSQFYSITDPDDADARRRTVYRTWIRSGRSPLLDVFDCPDPSTKTPVRAVTVTPLQALSLLNNSFVLRMADRFAGRLRREAGPEADEQIRRALELAYGRLATPAEVADYAPFVREQGLPEFCRVLLNSNEFLSVD